MAQKWPHLYLPNVGKDGKIGIWYPPLFKTNVSPCNSLKINHGWNKFLKKKQCAVTNEYTTLLLLPNRKAPYDMSLCNKPSQTQTVKYNVLDNTYYTLIIKLFNSFSNKRMGRQTSKSEQKCSHKVNRITSASHAPCVPPDTEITLPKSPSY